MKPSSSSRRRCYLHALLTTVFTSSTSPVPTRSMFLVPLPTVPLSSSTYRKHVLLERSSLRIEISVVFYQRGLFGLSVKDRMQLRQTSFPPPGMSGVGRSIMSVCVIAVDACDVRRLKPQSTRPETNVRVEEGNVYHPTHQENRCLLTRRPRAAARDRHGTRCDGTGWGTCPHSCSVRLGTQTAP